MRKPGAVEKNRQGMRVNRRVVQDLLGFASVFCCLVTIGILLTYTFSSSGVLAYQAAGGITVVFWICWLARLAFSNTRSSQRKPMDYSNGLFLILMILLFISLIVSEHFKFGIVSPFALFAAVFLCLSKALYNHMQGVDHTLDTVSQFSTQPVSAIRRHNNKIIGLFLFLAAVLTAVIFLTVSSTVLNEWMNRIGDAIIAFIRSIFRGEPIPPEQMMASDAGQGAPDMSMFDMGEPSPFMQILGWIIRHFFAVIIVLSFVTVVYLIFIQLKGFRFEKKTVTMDNGDISETVAPDPGENIFSRFGFGVKMPGHPVRRAFYKKIRRHRDMVEKSDTAAEMAEKIKEREDIGKLTDEYEKVRYTES